MYADTLANRYGTALGLRLERGGQGPSTSQPQPAQETQFPAFGADQPFQNSIESVIRATAEEDWISPFTLPSLPSLKPAHTDSNPLSSPPLHRKSSSSAYYAAAWGSPVTPETHRSIAPSRSPSRRNTNGYLVESRKSERSNWLSDSEGSIRSSPLPDEADNASGDWLGLDGDDQSDEVARTPTLNSFIESRNSVTGRARSVQPEQRHRIQDSTATIKQVDFWRQSAAKILPNDNRVGEMASFQPANGNTELMSMNHLSAGIDKPLPLAPGQLVGGTDMSVSGERPSVRPQIPDVLSPQRPKRNKVVWKGKSCIIGIPLEDGRGADDAQLLTPADVQTRLDQWEREGYNTRGFVLGDMLEKNSSDLAGGQSRKVHPDPADMLAERQIYGYKVSIPDKAEWDAWMELIKEEKLRALGVTISDSEPPPSTRSPFSSNASRASSQYPNLPFSPPQPPSSVGSSHLQNGHMFSPHIHPSTGASSHASLMASPSSHFVGLPGPMHRYKQSLAYPPMEARMTSPNYPVPHPTPPGLRHQSPPHYFAPRQSSISPAAVGGMPSLGEVLSPVSPFPPENYGGPPPLSVTLDGTRRHQQDLQAQMLRQQQQQIMLNQSHANVGAPATSDAEKQFRARVEIVHPTPRPHQRNLSEALQREIDEAETALERETQENGHLNEPSEKLLQANPSHAEAPVEPTVRLPQSLDTASAIHKAEVADQSEIETNPSLCNSPVPSRQVHAFSQPPEPAESKSDLPTSIGIPHKAKPSVSKLNVEAKEFKFDPKAAFISSNFQFGSNAFQPNATPAQLNAAAPEFQPLTAMVTRQSAAKSNFSSATFNVDAPVFNPSASGGSHFESSVASGSDDPSSTTSKIFGIINIDPSSKATRRSSKALPIIKPAFKESDVEERDKVEEDDAGRIGPSLARSKRARRRGDDGDEEAVYAPQNERTMKGQEVESTEQPGAFRADVAPPTSADTDKQSSPDKWEPFTFKDEVDASNFNTARPLPSPRPILTSIPTIDAGELGGPTQPNGHQTKRSLSASAPPFVPLSAQQAGAIPRLTHNTVKPRKSIGLEASRFAATPSPPTSPPLPTSLAKADMLYKEIGLAAAADDVPASRQELNNSRILEEIISEAHMSEAEKSVGLSDIDDGSNISLAEVDIFEPRPDLRNSRILEEIVSEAHLSDAGKSSLTSEIDEDPVSSVPELTSVSKTSDRFREHSPSYEDINEVMKQLENDPDLGVERLDTPPIRSSPGPTPQLPPVPNIRSDAPSPSPRRIQEDYLPQGSTRQDLRMPFANAEPGLDFPVRKLNGQNDGEISDWNAEVSSSDAQKVQSRAQFFDAHVVDLVGGVLDNRVGPMERTLKTIQHSLTVMATRPTSSRRERRSLSTDNMESDADDEDDQQHLDVLSRYQTRSPAARKDQKSDRIRIAVQEALAAHKAQNGEPRGSDLSAIHEMLAEMRHLAQQFAPESRQAELKAVVEDVIATHPRLRGHRVQQSHDFGSNEEKSKLQISGLESMLKIANERADQVTRSRQNAEDELADALRQLKYAEEEAAHHRESSEEAERTLLAYHREKESLADLQETVSQLSLKNAALETTLERYRLSREEWQEDIQEEQIKNKELRHTIHNLKRHLEESFESKQALRSKVDRLQENLAAVVKDIASDQALSRKKELELVAKNERLRNALDHEIRRREKCELELDELDKEHKQNVQFRDQCSRLQQENLRLEQSIAVLRQEYKETQDVAFQSQRELQVALESTERQLRQAKSGLEADLKLATSQASIIRADLEAQIARFQASLEHAELDASNAKAKHDALLEETLEAHNRALQQAAEEKDEALQDQQSAHEKKLNDLRERHTRALHNSSDDRHRLEHHLNEKLKLSEDKVQHLESKVTDLQERLEITKSAARAAVEAATSKGINLPTPAPSVVASPPHSTIASMPLVKGSDIPEKISPQALRESIMVLQDQLQNREQKIEQLEAELAQVDREAPAKIKEQDTEIAWLRELLGVRIDDLEEIIKTLSQEDYDGEAVKDAAIRLRTNLQMEQQEKERATSGGSNGFPSIASLSNLTQSPRALPMAAAAAWGNWRKARDSSFGALTDLTNLGNQTPSRSTFGGSPQGFLAGLMTPPGTNQRQATPTAGNATAPPSMMSLGAGGRKTSGEARPLRAYNMQARSLSARQMEKQPVSGARTSSQQRSMDPEPPSTPPLMRRGSYDGDADVRSISGDLDADASPIERKQNMLSGDRFGGETDTFIRSPI
jgi:hypothetical protein